MRPHEAASPRPLKLSARASPDPELIYRWEPFDAIVKELPPLFQRHWNEVESFKEELPLDPDWQQLFAYAAAGVLHVLTVRMDEVLVGYGFLVFNRHLHSTGKVTALLERFWLDPLFRHGWAGIRLVQEAEKRARELKADLFFAAPKTFNNVAKIFDRLGFKLIETVHAKVLT